MDPKEEIRSRLNIEDVVGEYVQLKRAGRNFKGLSPFSDEKTPSFFVSPDKNIWHDFSSNKGGDVFSFIMEVEGLDFRGALEYLAKKAGVELEKFESSRASDYAKQKKRALEAHDLAANYYQQTLVKNQHALEYTFKTRGLSKEIVQDFRIGYAPSSGLALKSALKKRNFSDAELKKFGLLNSYNKDVFRSRLTIPLMDESGQIIGFTGRLLGEVPNAPKYLNTPETILYNKSRHVFALSQAKQAIRSVGFVVIVEGNMDVISSHQVGVKNVVATAGTAITEQQITILKRLTSDIRISYDGDKAGLAATERAIEVAAGLQVDLKVISIREGAKDPDELIKQDVELWRSTINSPIPAVEWLIDRYADNLDLNTARGKQELVNLSDKLLSRLSAPAEVRFYIKKIATLIGFGYEEVLEMMRSAGTGQPKTVSLKPVKAPTDDSSDEKSYKTEDDVLSIASIDTNSRELLKEVREELFHGEDRLALLRFLKSSQKILDEDLPDNLQKHQTYVNIVILRASMRYSGWDSNDLYYEIARLIRQITNEQKKLKQSELVNQLRNAERLGDDALANDIRHQLNDLIKEIARGKR